MTGRVEAESESDARPMPRVLHRDERIIVFDKPVRLLSVPGIGPDKQDCLIVRAQRRWPNARIVHRLDYDTSGVIVLATDAEAHRELSRQFHDREVRKTYIAIVYGHVRDNEGKIDLPLRKDMDPANKPRQIIDHDRGRPAITRYTAIERTYITSPDAPFPSPSGRGARGEGAEVTSHEDRTNTEEEPLPDSRCSPPIPKGSGEERKPSSTEEDSASRIPITRLELRPVTGRSHQLRLHLKTIGHPILGDDLYAPPEVLRLSDRLLLHAESLTIVHPSNAAPMTFTAPCPF